MSFRNSPWSGRTSAWAIRHDVTNRLLDVSASEEAISKRFLELYDSGVPCHIIDPQGKVIETVRIDARYTQAT